MSIIGNLYKMKIQKYVQTLPLKKTQVKCIVGLDFYECAMKNLNFHASDPIHYHIR